LKEKNKEKENKNPIVNNNYTTNDNSSQVFNQTNNYNSKSKYIYDHKCVLSKQDKLIFYVQLLYQTRENLRITNKNHQIRVKSPKLYVFPILIDFNANKF
jgi:hypothetical protein